MDSVSSPVAESSRRLFADMMAGELSAKSASGDALADAWSAVEAQGLPLALLSEAQGGFGLTPVEATQIIRLAGSYAVPLPLGEAMVANRILAIVGLPVPGGMVSLATGDPQDRTSLTRTGAGWRLTGVAHRVPWGRSATILVPALDDHARPRLELVGRGLAEVATDINLAMEPRDTLRFDIELPESAVAVPSEGFDLGQLRVAGAAVRCLAMAGASERLLDLTVAHANDRAQFGKSIGKFQAMQQILAVIAEEVAACGAAADMAAAALGSDWLPIAAGKVRCGEAAGVIAATSHQVHGAIGFSEEHALHYFTKRLWSWRDEFGAEAEWALQIGRRVARQGADQLWPLITDS